MAIIAHLDMDAFFASVEEREHEWLRGLPIVVGADPKNGMGRGVVSTANYKARRYGIHSAMPITKAWRLAEVAKKDGHEATAFLSPDFSKYSASSVRIFSLVRSGAPHIEEAGIDEAYIDMSFAGSYERAEEICRTIKQEIFVHEKLTSSVGIGPNKLIAKIASDRKKPDGFTVVRETEAESFLEPLPIRVIPGIGPKTEAFLKSNGVFLVRDLKPYSQKECESMLGKWGLSLYEKIRGHGSSVIEESSVAKSVGEQETFAYDTIDPSFLLSRLQSISKTVMARFRQDGFRRFRTVSITVRFSDFTTSTRAHSQKDAQISEDVLQFEAMRLFMPFLDGRENPRRQPIRLIGVRVENIS